MRVKYQGGLKWQIWIEIRVKSQGVVNSRAGKMHINTVVYVDIGQGIHRGKNKVTRNDKWKDVGFLIHEI